MNAIAEKLIVDAVSEALGGIITTHRTAARVAGQNSVRVKIPLVEIRERVKSRIDGLHGVVGGSDDDDETDDSLSEIEAAVQSLITPSVAELREEWLPMVIVGWEHAVLTDDSLELDIIVPPTRKAHTR